MNEFLNENFLLKTDFAQRLYHNYAKDLPIIDYHCHLPPKEIAENRQFENLTKIWLDGDHYKWRAMRTLGINEKFITGNAPDQEKFQKWAFAVPYTMRNPLYHWTHLEMQRYFDNDTLLSDKTADSVYNESNEKLKTAEYSARNIIKKMNVEVVCTTDDPIDSLEYHKILKADGYSVKVLPAFRPDKAYAVENPDDYNNYLDKLAEVSNTTINSFDDLLSALNNRIEYFHQNGCRLSDHGLEHLFFPNGNHAYTPEELFKKVKNHKTLSPEETQFFKYSVLIELCKTYHSKNWVQQFHLGALRNTNARMRATLGPDTGFDSIGDYSQAVNLSKFLNQLDSSDQLCKTVIYNLNPSDNEVFASMIGNFNDGTVIGKMQYGSGWWYLDQKDGMEKQLNTLSNIGILSTFIGMLTDSRSFMSYPRHEYFRRILCNLIGQDVANGELPADEKWLGKLVSDISYHNAKNYFEF